MSSGGKLRGKPGEPLEEAHKFFPPFIPLQCSPLVKAEKDWMVSPSYHLSGKQFPGADLYFKSRDDQHVVGSEAGGACLEEALNAQLLTTTNGLLSREIATVHCTF